MKFTKLPVSKPTEDSVENYLVSRCAALGVPCEKLKGTQGWFDRIVFWNGGKPSLVETKRPKGGRYEPLQLRTHAKYRKLGYDVAVLYTKTEVDEFICKHSFLTLTSAKRQRHSTLKGSASSGLKRGRSTHL